MRHSLFHLVNVGFEHRILILVTTLVPRFQLSPNTIYIAESGIPYQNDLSFLLSPLTPLSSPPSRTTRGGLVLLNNVGTFPHTQKVQYSNGIRNLFSLSTRSLRLAKMMHPPRAIIVAAARHEQSTMDNKNNKHIKASYCS